MLEWLVGWVTTNAFGLLVKTILNEDFAKDLAKDYAKDFFKDRFNNVPIAIFQKEPLQKAIAKALKEFLQLVEDELKRRKVADADIKNFAKPLKTFVYNKSVKEILGKAFDANCDECDELDYQSLENIWKSLNLPALPAKFNWQVLTYNYITKAQEILSDSNELRDILFLQKVNRSEKYHQENGSVTPDFDLRRYQEAIRERYVNLKLESLNTDGCAYNNLRLWRIFIPQNVREVEQVLPEVPKEHFRRLQESNQLDAEFELEKLEAELKRHRQLYFEQPILSVLDIFKDKQSHKYTVILGDPGSGKSSLLQYLALDWVENTLDKKDINLPIPLLIELRTYARNHDEGLCKNFLEFYHQSPSCLFHLNQQKLHKQLKAGNALVMFDGLDEVFDPRKREDVITTIHRFTNEYPNVQVIVTSRVIGYKPQLLRDAQFRHFMLQDLDLEQIREFLDKWHDDTFNNESDKVIKLQRLQRAINESKAIAELAGNPLLLTMMAILNRNQELPRDRATLYEQASRILLHQWDVEAKVLTVADIDPDTIDLKDKQAMLRQVAYKMQAAETGLAGNLISKDDLENTLIAYLQDRKLAQERRIARLMIEQLRERNFVLCFFGADYYAFVHRTFLEYFCAWEFVWRFEKERSLSIEELKIEVFGKHWQDESWHEVLHLIAGMIDAKFVGEILEYLMAQNGQGEKFTNLFLAATCLVEVRNRSVIASTAKKLLDQIKDLTKYDLSYDYEQYGDEARLVRKIRTQAVTAVATTWKDDTNTLDWLKDRAIADNDMFVRRAVVQALASNFKEHPDTLPILKRAIADNNEDVRRAVVSALASNFKEHPNTLPFLLDRAIADNDMFVRGAVVEALASNFKEHPNTLPFLLDRAIADNDMFVRGAVVQALASNFKEHPNTLPFLLDRAIADNDMFVRGAVVSALASNFKEHPNTLPFLKRAIADNDMFVRGAVVQALASNFKEHPDTLPFLKRAIADNDMFVRRAVVQALASNFKEHPDTLPFLKRAIADNDMFVRRAVVQALASNFKEHPDTLPFLKRAIADNNEYVRRAVVEALDSNFKEHPDTLPILLDRAIADNDEYVRRAVVSALVRNFKEHPDTLPLLLDRAIADNDEYVRGDAVSALASNFKEHPDTLPLLLDRAIADNHEYVRGAAVSALASNFKDEPGMFELFYNCAFNDPFQREEDWQTNPRQVALEVIIKHYPEHPQILPLLRDRAENDTDEEVREFACEKLAEFEK
ncbi:MAG: HEAT repeat domain-containing protein [Heteroscytonema crispum UTEX LB 1556]